MSRSPRETSDLAEQAAEWVARLDDDASPECRAELVNWLRLSPHHIEEFLLAQAAYRAFHGMSREQLLPVDSEELRAGNAANVIPIKGRGSESRDVSPANAMAPAGTTVEVGIAGKTNRRWLFGLAAGVAVVAAGLWALPRLAEKSYATAIGEQRTVRLPDGSLLHLNTQSRIKVALSRDARRIELLRGEVLFDVARDQSRPFVVAAGEAVVKVLGTQFNVYRRDAETTVSVVEGRVQVDVGEKAAPAFSAASQSPTQAAPTVLTAGDEARITQNGRILRTAKVNVETALAWRQRRLIFNGTTLAEAIEQFNRYNDFHIELGSDALAQRRISGVFHADDPMTILKFLQRDAEIAVNSGEKHAVVRLR